MNDNIKITVSTPITKSYLMLFTFPDGCAVHIAGDGDRSKGYKFSADGGLVVECPHGYTISVEGAVKIE